MKAYRKRLKGNWTQGKRHKGDGEERQFSKKEIKAELAASEESFLEKHRKGKRTRNQKARLEHRIAWYEERIAWYKRLKVDRGCLMTDYFRDSLSKARKQLAELIEKEKQK